MKKLDPLAPSLPLSPRGGRRASKWKTVVPALIMVAVVVVAALLLLQEQQDLAEQRTLIHEENRLRMQSSLAHVEEYFDAIHSTLLFISLDKDVTAMRRDSRQNIQRFYDHQWDEHRLAEVYIVERNFRGDRPPFMAFEREGEELETEDAHSLSREVDEYRLQIQQMQRFSVNSSLKAQLSSETFLCVPDAKGGRSRGFVYSLPIRSDEELVGLVAGMVQKRDISKLLRRGVRSQVAFLASERGDLVLPEGVDPEIERWFQQQFQGRSTDAFFAGAAESFAVHQWQAHWAPVKMVASQKWWLVYLHPVRDYQAKTLLTGWFGHFAIAVGLVGGGLVLAFLVWSLEQRLEDQARHMEERRQLERALHELSEREQRLIGETLREDLCQRLTGIEAVSKVLKKRLASAHLPETQLAGEIAGEIRDSVVSARQMAAELQPVARLEHGFVAALEELAALARQHTGIICQVEDHGFPADLDISVATHLYRIAQEAVANAVQHAQAKAIRITLAADETHLTLGIRDDGVGLPAAAEAGPGTGLRIMRYRADLLGAEFGIRRADPHGTEVFARFPRPAAAYA